MSQFFWSSQPLLDVLYTTMGLGWLLGLLLLLAVPGLAGLVINSYLHSRTESISAYIARFVPYPLYAGGVYVLGALSGANLLLSGLSRTGLLANDLSYELAWLVYLGCFLALISWYAIYRVDFAFWSYLYMPRDGAQLLGQDYFVLATLRSLLMLPMTLLFLSPASDTLCLWLTAMGFLLLQGLRWVQVFRRLWSGGNVPIYIFLYLCGHELLPWGYLILGIGYIGHSEYIEYIT